MNQPGKRYYEFGSFRLDPEERLLLRDGKRVRLTPKVFDTLTALVLHGGHLVLKEHLMETLWPNSFVEEDNLTQNISMLRKALGERAHEQRYIVTVPGKGYRFAAEVIERSAESEKPAELLVASYTRSRVLIEEAEEEPASGVLPLPAARTVSISSQKLKVSGVVTVLIASLLLFSFSFYSRRKVGVTETKIVLADFDNRTGEPVFDDTLKQGLRVQLEQSPFLNLLSDQNVDGELKLMARPSGQRLTPELARDLCQRIGSKAVLKGSISRLGAHYVIGLNAFDCHTGDELADEQAEADGPEHVLRALGELATNMRKRLGESLASIQKYDVALEPTTTSSLEALRAYALGMSIVYTRGSAAALPFFQRATELDPGFAMAYARLAALHGDLGEDELAAENARWAYDLRDKVSERERFYIQAHYYDTATGDLEKAAQVYELWGQTYPQDGRHNLISLYTILSKFDNSFQKADEVLRLYPQEEANDADFYFSAALAHIFVGHFDKAEALLKQARDHKLESADLLSLRYLLAFVKGDAGELERLVTSAVGSPGTESLLLDNEACARAYRGRLKEAREAFQKAMVSSGQNTESRERTADIRADASLIEAYLGDRQHARAEADAALKLAVNRYVGVHAALALALAGDSARAGKLASELNKRFPSDSELQRYWLPTIRGTAALQQSKAQSVTDLLAPIGSYELTPFELTPLGQLDTTYLRGQAHLALHAGGAAAAEFQRILDHPGLVLISPVGALARLGLGRAYVLQGDREKARVAYQDFLTLWKDADPGIPILRAAKAEYAKLN